MSDYLTELNDALTGRDDEPVTGADLRRALIPIAQALDQLQRTNAALEEHRETLLDTVEFVNQLQERLMIVDALPANAPLGSLIRLRNGTVAQRLPLYLGNGPDQPITKLTPVVV